MTGESVSTVIDALVRYPPLLKARRIVELTVENDKQLVEEWQDLGPPL